MFPELVPSSDQLFSWWSRMKYHTPYHDLAAFLHATHEAYKSAEHRPDFLFLHDVLDWHSFFEGHLPELGGHKKPLIWRIHKDLNSGRVVLHYKCSSEDKEWLGENGDAHGKPLIALSTCPEGLPRFTQSPLPVPPEIVRGVQGCFPFVEEASVTWLKNALQGNFGVELLDDKLTAGQLGRSATITVGNVTMPLRVVCAPLPADMLSLPKLQSPLVQPPLELKVPVHLEHLKVTNHPLSKSKRGKVAQSSSDGQCPVSGFVPMLPLVVAEDDGEWHKNQEEAKTKHGMRTRMVFHLTSVSL